MGDEGCSNVTAVSVCGINADVNRSLVVKVVVKDTCAAAQGVWT